MVIVCFALTATEKHGSNFNIQLKTEEIGHIFNNPAKSKRVITLVTHCKNLLTA